MKSAPSIEIHRPKGLFVGLATVDLSYQVDQIPWRNQKISVPAQLITAGGPATNAAATFAFLGGRTTLVTAVGSHALAAVIRSDLARLSIRLHDMARGRRESPPVSSVTVHRASGDRTVVSANAAVFSTVNAEFDPKWLRGVSIVEVDGQYMPLCIAAARAACERGIPVVLDSGSWKPGMPKLLPFLDTVICSGDFRPPGCRSDKGCLRVSRRAEDPADRDHPRRFVDTVCRGRASRRGRGSEDSAGRHAGRRRHPPRGLLLLRLPAWCEISRYAGCGRAVSDVFLPVCGNAFVDEEIPTLTIAKQLNHHRGKGR